MKVTTQENITTGTTEVNYRKNTASFRSEIQLGGVGLNACGSYVADKVNVTSIEGAFLMLAAGKIKWAEDRIAVIAKGKHGTALRFGRRSICGVWLDVIGQHGGRGIIGLDLLGEAGSITVLSLSELATMLAVAQDYSFTRKSDGQVFAGKLVGSVNDKIASLAVSINGKLQSIDVETRENGYNGEVLGALGGKNDKMAAKTAEEIAALAAGVKAAKAKVKRKVAKKAIATEEAAEEAVVEVAG